MFNFSSCLFTHILPLSAFAFSLSIFAFLSVLSLSLSACLYVSVSLTFTPPFPLFLFFIPLRSFFYSPHYQSSSFTPPFHLILSFLSFSQSTSLPLLAPPIHLKEARARGGQALFMGHLRPCSATGGGAAPAPLVVPFPLPLPSLSRILHCHSFNLYV